LVSLEASNRSVESTIEFPRQIIFSASKAMVNSVAGYTRFWSVLRH